MKYLNGRLAAGRHKGRLLRNVPGEYIRWLLRANETLGSDLVADLLREMHRRLAEVFELYGLSRQLPPFPDDWLPGRRK